MSHWRCFLREIVGFECPQPAGGTGSGPSAPVSLIGASGANFARHRTRGCHLSSLRTFVVVFVDAALGDDASARVCRAAPTWLPGGRAPVAARPRWACATAPMFGGRAGLPARRRPRARALLAHSTRCGGQKGTGLPGDGVAAGRAAASEAPGGRAAPRRSSPSLSDRGLGARPGRARCPGPGVTPLRGGSRLGDHARVAAPSAALQRSLWSPGS